MKIGKIFFETRKLSIIGLSLHWWFCTLAAPSAPAQSRSVVHDKVSDWLAGRLDGVAVSQDGVLSPGMVTADVLELGVDGVDVVWSALKVEDGSLLLGTGPEGKILHVSKEQEVTVLADLEQAHVFALATSPDGRIWAAASPGGAVYLIKKEEEPEKWWGGAVEYVWEILASDKDLILATGRPAQLVRLVSVDEREIICEVPDTHVRSLTKWKEGSYLLGTSGRGLLLSWDGSKLNGLFASDRSEVRQIGLRGDDEVIFLAVGDVPTSGTAARSSRVSSSSNVNSSSSSPSSGSSRSGGETFDVFSSLGGEKDSNAQRGTPDVKGDLWSWTPTGGGKKLLSAPGQPHSFGVIAGNVFVGSGSRGYVFQVDSKQKVSAVAQAASNYVTGFLVDGDEMRLIGSFPASVMRLEKAKKVNFESVVIDASAASLWGNVNVLGEVDVLERRYGWTPDPDSLWSDWSEAGPKLNDATLRPRYMQYRLSPKVSGVRRVEIFYTLINRSPEFKEVRVLPTGEQFTLVESSQSGSNQQSLDQLLRSSSPSRAGNQAGGSGASQSSGSSDGGLNSTRVLSVGGHTFRTLIFVVDDADGDPLEFDVAYRNFAGGDFILLKDRIEKPFFSFDTRGWRDGWYEFRVTASDKPVLGVQSSSSEYITEPVLIDNSPPEISFLSSSSEELVFQVTDSFSVLEMVSVSFDGVDFKPALPQDSVMDSKSETFSVPFESIIRGGVFVRAQDRAGNRSGQFISLEK